MTNSCSTVLTILSENKYKLTLTNGVLVVRLLIERLRLKGCLKISFPNASSFIHRQAGRFAFCGTFRSANFLPSVYLLSNFVFGHWTKGNYDFTKFQLQFVLLIDFPRVVSCPGRWWINDSSTLRISSFSVRTDSSGHRRWIRESRSDRTIEASRSREQLCTATGEDRARRRILFRWTCINRVVAYAKSFFYETYRRMCRCKTRRVLQPRYREYLRVSNPISVTDGNVAAWISFSLRCLSCSSTRSAEKDRWKVIFISWQYSSSAYPTRYIFIESAWCTARPWDCSRLPVIISDNNSSRIKDKHRP